jgi:hypothetical protein
MANVFCSSTGTNTAPYETWAKAATTFATAIGATSAGDIVAVDATNPPADIAANTTWTFVSDCTVVASTNSGTSTITPTTMGTSTWLGNSTTSYSLTLAGAFKVRVVGLTFRIAGTSNVSMVFNNTSGGQFDLDDCYFWLGTTGSNAAAIRLGSSSSNNRSATIARNCTFRFGNALNVLSMHGGAEIIGGSISTAGSAPTVLLQGGNSQQSAQLTGVDLSHVTGSLVGNHTSGPVDYRFINCRLSGSLENVLATQTAANKSGARAWVHDCSSGDTHVLLGYYDALGSCVSDTAIYLTAGAAAQSWRITTTANSTVDAPFLTPWIDLYHTGTSSITPTVQVARDGSTTAYTDAQLWAEFTAKTTSNSTIVTRYADRVAVAGTPANQATGVGTGSWTGLSGTAWSGALDTGSAITPAEAGHISARVAFGPASSTVYLNPAIAV